MGGDIVHVFPVRRCFFSVIEIFSVVKLKKTFWLLWMLIM